MKVPFQTVDVFTDRRFGGNPLAVIPDARGLSSEQMQSIAAENNLPETAFIARDGQSNWLEGAELLTVYAILAVAFYYIPK